MDYLWKDMQEKKSLVAFKEGNHVAKGDFFFNHTCFYIFSFCYPVTIHFFGNKLS